MCGELEYASTSDKEQLYWILNSNNICECCCAKMNKYFWNTVKVQMTQISWEITFSAHQTCVALPALSLTSALYFSTCPMAGESGWRPRGKTFSSRPNPVLPQLTQEGGRDGKDSCPLGQKLWTNTVPRDKSQYGHLNKASKTTTNLIRLCSFKSSCEFGFIAYPKRSGLSIASRPFG